MLNTIRPIAWYADGALWLAERHPKNVAEARLILGPLRYSLYDEKVLPGEHAAYEYHKIGQTDGGIGRELRNAERERKGLSAIE